MTISSKHVHSILLSRRGLLKAIGITAGAAALSPLALRLANGATVNDSLAVGVLLPHSRLYTNLGSSLLVGLQLALATRAARPVQLLIEEYGVFPSAAAAAGQRLIEQGADVLVGMISTSGINQLRPMLEARQVPLIATTAGANVVQPAAESSYVFHTTLATWQASHASGTWAAQRGQRAFIAASFHNSGYDAFDAFRVGFENAGGEVVGTQITHIPGAPIGLDVLMQSIAQERPDVVYAAYAGIEAVDFFGAYAKADFANRMTVLTNNLIPLDQPELDVTRIGAWSSAFNTPANNDFQRAYVAATGRPADAFAALGYDTGLLLAHSSDKHHSLRASLAASRIVGVRGELAFDSNTQLAGNPLYMSQLSSDGERLIGELPITSGLVEYAATVRAALKTGWLNAYLCV